MEQSTMESGANKRRLLISISLIVGLIILVTACVSWVSGDDLSPAEQTALDFVKVAHVDDYNPEKLKTYLQPENLEPSQFQDSKWVKPGEVLVGSKKMEFSTEVVIFFKDPNMSTSRNRVEVTLIQENGRWLVTHEEFRGTSNNDFDQFKQTDDFKELGIDEWKSAELSN